MTIKITKGTDIILTQNLITVLYGDPGAGKTSLGFSANKPLLIDTDLGAHRCIGRKDSIQAAAWDDIAELNTDTLQVYETIVVDTAGRLLDLLAQDVVKRNPKAARSTGELTQQGYGALGIAFKAWLTKIKSYKKDIVLILHAKEEKENEQKYMRLDAAGSSRIEVTKIADLIGYVYMKGSARILNFNPTEQHIGKNSANFEAMDLPNYADNPNFLAEIIASTKTHLNNKSQSQIETEKQFNKIITKIDEAITPEDYTALIASVQNHDILKRQLHNKAKKLGLIFNPTIKGYQLSTEGSSAL